MKKLLLGLLLVLAGFSLRLVAEEFYSFYSALKYERCANSEIIRQDKWTQKQKDNSPSAYQTCKGLLTKHYTGDILAVNPEVWCNLDPFLCENSFLKVEFLTRKHWITNDQLGAK